MASKPGFFDYMAAAFNARPIGMFVAPNWIGLAAFGGDFSGIRRFAERDHSNIVRWTTFESGGHFAAHKQPEWLIGDVREFFTEGGSRTWTAGVEEYFAG